MLVFSGDDTVKDSNPVNDSNRRCALIIAYFFPPKPVIGSVRMEGLARYLPEEGWDVVVLTAKHPGGPDPRFAVYEVDHKHWLRVLESSGQAVHHAISSRKSPWLTRLYRWTRSVVEATICYPDAQRGWYKSAVATGLSIIRNRRVDAIISTSKPETSHLIASALCRRAGVPWVADYRDLWTLNHYLSDTNRWLWRVRRVFERRLELRTMQAARAIVTVSDPLARAMRQMFPDKLISSIPNGFDPEIYVREGEHSLTQQFTITYTGTLYGGRRDPSRLFRVVRDLREEGRVNPDILRIRFYGSEQDVVLTKAKEYNVEAFVEACGRISRLEALERQRESHVLLSLNWDNDWEAGVYTGKLFEYLAASRPILAMGGPGGVVKELLESTGAGVHVSSVQELRHVLISWLNEYQRKGSVSYLGKPEVVEQYSQRAMAVRFKNILETVVV